MTIFIKETHLLPDSLNVLNFKGMSSVSSVKYNKTLKALPLCLYESMQLLMRANVARF